LELKENSYGALKIKTKFNTYRDLWNDLRKIEIGRYIFHIHKNLHTFLVIVPFNSKSKVQMEETLKNIIWKV